MPIYKMKYSRFFLAHDIKWVDCGDKVIVLPVESEANAYKAALWRIYEWNRAASLNRSPVWKYGLLEIIIENS